MIYDRLENCYLYFPIHKEFEKAFSFLKKADFNKMEPGRYILENEKLFASVEEYRTKTIYEKKWEVHKKYIDIQYVIDGDEVMGYTNIENIQLTVPYDEDKDILFGEGNGEYTKVRAGEFVIFMPHDAHMPGISLCEKSSYVKKVVMKILID